MQSRADAVLRWLVLLLGVATISIVLVGLIETKLILLEVEPWWLIGIVGLGVVLLALGSPRAGRASGD